MNTGITSIHSPNPSFFRRRKRKTTNSFGDSSTSDDGSSDSSSSESSSSSIRSFRDVNSRSQSHSSSFSRSIDKQNNNLENNNNNNNNNNLITSASSPIPPPLKRVHLKISLALIKIRQALKSSQWDELSISLRQLSSALPSDLSSLGLYIPVLERLGEDLIIILGGEEKDLGRAYRKGISKEDAKSLVSLKQKWTASGTSGSSKGKGKEVESEWYSTARVLVSKNSRPSFISRPHTEATTSLLSSLESILLATSLPKIVLSELDLTFDSISDWEVLRRSEEVLEWYLSFEEQQYKLGRARVSLAGIKSLDLSKNRLTDLPIYLTQLFPSVEILSLSHNLFRYLPPAITLFSYLRRLKTHGNKLSKSRGGVSQNAKEIARIVRGKTHQEDDNGVESLSSIVVMVLQNFIKLSGSGRKFAVESDDDDSGNEVSEGEAQLDTFNISKLQLSLPRHLQSLISTSYNCSSCQKFISPNSPSFLPPLFEKIHHLDPGVAIPTYLSLPPAPYVRTRSDSQSSFSQLLLDSPPSSPSSSDRPPHLLSLEEKVFVALLSRGTGLATYVIGGYSFCAKCSLSHLGLREDLGYSKECHCLVCEEERKVRVKDYGVNTVMRWLRRRPGALKDL